MTEFEEDLMSQTLERIAARGSNKIALVGASASALMISERLAIAGLSERTLGIFDPRPEAHVVTAPWEHLALDPPDLIVIAVDKEKEALLRSTAETLEGGLPEVVLAGTRHLEFSDQLYDELDSPALVRSYATGYEHTRVHIFQHLKAASSLGLGGAIVEFGAFKGGTSAWLVRVVKALGLRSRVIAFDSWDGFPPRRSILDLYTHPRCVFRDLSAVRTYLTPLGVELVVGDISDTAEKTLRSERILLAFVDTDNYSPARAAIATVLPNLVLGGAIVLDHYATTPDYTYTVGERIAADELLQGSGLLNLHGTGVFVKIGDP